MVLYENYVTCIFMNINENLKIREKHWINYFPGGGGGGGGGQSDTYIEYLGHFLMDTNSLNGTTKMQKILSSKLRPLWLCEIA